MAKFGGKTDADADDGDDKAAKPAPAAAGERARVCGDKAGR